MTKIGVHAAVWVGGWSPEECRRAISSTADVGFDVIEIPLLDPARVDAQDTREVLEQHGLEAVCSLGLTAETDVSSGRQEAVDAGRRLLVQALDATHELGARYLGGVLYGAMGRHAETPSEAGRAEAVGAIAELCETAAPLGITIGLETVNRYESNLLNTAEQTLAFVADVGAPNLVVHLDSYHMNIEEDGLSSPVMRCGERLGYVHVGENHRGPLGTGNIDFAELFRALNELGYDGTITFESFSSAVVDPWLSNTLCIWRELWADSRALASDALRYIERERAAVAA